MKSEHTDTPTNIDWMVSAIVSGELLNSVLTIHTRVIQLDVLLSKQLSRNHFTFEATNSAPPSVFDGVENCPSVCSGGGKSIGTRAFVFLM